MISVCVEPEFDEIVKIADKIAKGNGISRSVIMRTVLHDFFGVPTDNPKLQQKLIGLIKQSLSEIKQVEQSVAQAVEC